MIKIKTTIVSLGLSLLLTIVATADDWPSQFPYPADFPTWPSSHVSVSGSGTSAGDPFVATYTAAGGQKIMYIYTEYTSEQTTHRSRKRETFVPTPNEGDVRTSVSGFDDYIDLQMGPPSGIFGENVMVGQPGFYGIDMGQYTIGWSHVALDFTLTVSNLGNIIANQCQPLETQVKKTTQIFQNSAKMLILSSVATCPTHLNPTVPLASESIQIEASMNNFAWELKRTLSKPNSQSSKTDSNKFPNSGGTGDTAVSNFGTTLNMVNFYRNEFEASDFCDLMAQFMADGNWSITPW